MREKELRKHAICDVCHNPIGNSGVPVFWTAEVERHGLKMDVINRQDGLTAQLGGHAPLAAIMGPNEEMTEPLMEKAKLTVCQTCSLKPICLAEMVEQD